MRNGQNVCARPEILKLIWGNEIFIHTKVSHIGPYTELWVTVSSEMWLIVVIDKLTPWVPGVNKRMWLNGKSEFGSGSGVGPTGRRQCVVVGNLCSNRAGFLGMVSGVIRRTRSCLHGRGAGSGLVGGSLAAHGQMSWLVLAASCARLLSTETVAPFAPLCPFRYFWNFFFNLSTITQLLFSHVLLTLANSKSNSHILITLVTLIASSHNYNYFGFCTI